MGIKLTNHLHGEKKYELREVLLHKATSAPADAVAGQMYYNTDTITPANNGFYVYNGSAWKKLSDQTMSASDINTALGTLTTGEIDFNTTLNMNSKPIIGVTMPTSENAADGDVTNRKFVVDSINNAIQGLDVKQSVIAASTVASGNVAYTRDVNVCTVTSPFSTLDGINIATVGTRILLKNQTDAQENLIYRVSAVSSGNVTELTIVRSDMELPNGGGFNENVFVFVERGTTQADTGWVASSSTGAPLFLGNNVTWHQFASAGQITVGTGITRSGNVISLDTANGYGVRKLTGFVPNGNVNATIAHALNTQDVVVSIRDAVTNEIVLADVVATSTTSITVSFAEAPTLNQYRYTIIG
jgi:hypothetical protein